MDTTTPTPTSTSTQANSRAGTQAKASTVGVASKAARAESVAIERTLQPARQRPAHEVQLGTVKAAVWANPTPRGGVAYCVTVQRIYKDAGLWKRSDSFRRDDLLTLGKVLSMAHSWIHERARRRGE